MVLFTYDGGFAYLSFSVCIVRPRLFQPEVFDYIEFIITHIFKSGLSEQEGQLTTHVLRL